MGNDIDNDVYLLSEHIHALDKGFDLFRLSYRQNNWDEADRIANQILSLAEHLYENKKKWGEIVSPLNQMIKRPLIFYFGYGYLAKSIVYQKQGLLIGLENT